MIKKIEHIGVAVKNIENSVHIFRDLLGIPLEKVYESDAIKTKIAFFPLGDSTIELIEPMDPSSPAAKFIEKRGEGIHHVCLGVEDIEAALRDALSKASREVIERVKDRFEQVRHRPPTPLPGPRELVVACAPLRSNVNLSTIVRTAGCCGVERLIVCGNARIDRTIARDGAVTCW